MHTQHDVAAVRDEGEQEAGARDNGERKVLMSDGSAKQMGAAAPEIGDVAARGRPPQGRSRDPPQIEIARSRAVNAARMALAVVRRHRRRRHGRVVGGRLATAAELRTPLRLDGGARESRRRWPAFEAWTATTLLNHTCHDVPIDVELSELHAFTSYEPDADAARHLLRLDENRANAASRRWTTTFGTFVRYTLGRSERAPYAYLSVPLARILRDTPDRSHGEHVVNDVMRVDDGGTAMIDDDTIQVDDELVVNGAARAREAPMVSLWAGGANVTTQAHYDLHANLFVQVAGRKRVALWPPEAAPSLYLYGALHPRASASRGCRSPTIYRSCPTRRSPPSRAPPA